MKRAVSRTLVAGIFWAFALAPTGRADWSFAMLGDTRGPHHTTNGVSQYLNAIATKIAEVGPELVLVCGDLVNGNDTNGLVSLSYAQQFDNWKTAMAPVSGAGIPIYPVRGNHENECNELAPIPELKQAYYDAFASTVPSNGPNHGVSNDQRGFSYAFTHKDVTFVAADQYFYYDQTPGDPGYHNLDRAWVAQQFQESASPYKVFMAHVPIFQTEGGAESERFFGDSSTGLATRAEFWDELGTNGVRLYLTGHIHNESVASATNGFGDTIVQLMAGNGGAPLDPVGGVHDAGVDLLYTNGTHYGFALATVGSNSMTIEYYLLDPSDEHWSKATYTTAIPAVQAVPEPSGLLLSAAGVLALALRRRPLP